MKISEIFEINGFTQSFPNVAHFRKDISETCSIHVNSLYCPQRKDVIEDKINSVFCFKVTVVNLPKQDIKIFGKIENALIYINTIN